MPSNINKWTLVSAKWCWVYSIGGAIEKIGGRQKDEDEKEENMLEREEKKKEKKT